MGRARFLLPPHDTRQPPRRTCRVSWSCRRSSPALPSPPIFRPPRRTCRVSWSCRRSSPALNRTAMLRGCGGGRGTGRGESRAGLAAAGARSVLAVNVAPAPPPTAGGAPRATAPSPVDADTAAAPSMASHKGSFLELMTRDASARTPRDTNSGASGSWKLSGKTMPSRPAASAAACASREPAALTRSATSVRRRTAKTCRPSSTRCASLVCSRNCCRMTL